VALNDCITDTMRYSVWHAGLLFGIEFESNGKWESDYGSHMDVRSDQRSSRQ